MARGTVRFFNPAKGFGFITPESGGSDVFVHITALQAAGLTGLTEGDVVSFELETDRRSGRTSAINLSQESSGNGAVSRPRPASTGFDRPFRSAPSAEHAGSGSGLVKWFNPDKGFGFIQPTEGGQDIFVHASALRRAGLDTLADGQPVSYDLERDGRTGKISAANLWLG